MDEETLTRLEQLLGLIQKQQEQIDGLQKLYDIIGRQLDILSGHVLTGKNV